MPMSNLVIEEVGGTTNSAIANVGVGFGTIRQIQETAQAVEVFKNSIGDHNPGTTEYELLRLKFWKAIRSWLTVDLPVGVNLTWTVERRFDSFDYEPIGQNFRLSIDQAHWFPNDEHDSCLFYVEFYELFSESTIKQIKGK